MHLKFYTQMQYLTTRIPLQRIKQNIQSAHCAHMLSLLQSTLPGISHLNDCARKHYVAGWCCEWALEVLLIAPKRLSSRLKVRTELNIFTAKCEPFFFIFHENTMYWFAVSSESILHISIDSIFNITFIIILKKICKYIVFHLDLLGTTHPYSLPLYYMYCHCKPYCVVRWLMAQ